MGQYLTGRGAQGVQITQEGLTIEGKVYNYNGSEGLLGMVIHGEDGNDSIQRIDTNINGEISVTSGEKSNTKSVGVELTTAGTGVLVDLSDTSTYPHNETGRLDVTNLLFTGRSNGDTDVEVGYYDGTTYHTITHDWIDIAGNRKVFFDNIRFANSEYRCSNLYSNAPTVGKAIVGIGKGDIWYDLSTDVTGTGNHIEILVQYHSHTTENEAE